MKKLLIILILIGSSSIILSAQSADDYNKGEVFAGYSTWFDGDSSAMHGFNAAGVYNFHKYLGVKVEGTAAFRNQNFTVSTWERKIYNVAAGVQVKNNRKEQVFRPFGHVLFGYGEYRSKTRAANTTFEFTEKGASFTVGGGLDFKVTDKIDVRAAQVDVTRILGADRIDIRFSTGVIFKF